MKKIISLAAILLTASASAAEQPLFGDINYFFKQGEMNVRADANVIVERLTAGGTKYEQNGYIFETQFTYGVANDLNAFVGLDYAFGMEVENKSDPSDTHFDQSGLGNPAFGVLYRVMNQDSGMFNFDFGATARVNLMDAEQGSGADESSRDGNFAESRSSLELLARVGKKWNEANEWQVAAGFVYFTDGELTERRTGGNVNVDEESSMDLFIRGSYQYRPVKEFMMLVSAQVDRVGEMTKDPSDVAGTEIYESHYDLDLEFTAKYLITSNIIGRFNFGMSNLADIDVVGPGPATGEISGRRENFYGLGVDLLF